ILGMKAKDLSNRQIGHKLGISETAVRKRLRRMGFKPPSRQGLLFEDQDASAKDQDASASSEPEAASTEHEDEPVPGSKAEEDAEDDDAPPFSIDTDPLDRALDRVCAALGLLDDAMPMFASAGSVPRGGVLLAIP